MKHLVIAVVATVMVIIYTISFWAFDLVDNRVWLSYIESLYHFGVIVAIAGFVLTQFETEEKTMMDYISQINQQQELGFIEIEKLFMNHYPELLPLYKELNQHNPLIQKIRAPSNINQSKKTFYEITVCNMIIQRIENTYLSISQLHKYFSFDHLGSREFNEWASTWKQWFKSPTLRRVWHSNKNKLFAQATADFIDREIIGTFFPKRLTKKIPGQNIEKPQRNPPFIT